MVKKLTQKIEVDMTVAKARKGKGKRVTTALIEVVGHREKDLSYLPPLPSTIVLGSSLRNIDQVIDARVPLSLTRSPWRPAPRYWW